jgi:putative restriction endonuclease
MEDLGLCLNAAMRAVVAVTDKRWSDYLRARDYLTEANFWIPSSTGFRALETGEPLLFKTHAPDNKLVGGGFLSGFVTLRVSEAWRFFGEGNGRASIADVLTEVNQYRRRQGKPWEPDPEIGCILLRNLFFAPPGQDLPAPPEFSRGGIQRYKRYDLTVRDTSHIASALESLQVTARIDVSWNDDLQLDVLGPTKGDPRLTTPRVGQDAFKALVLGAYQRHCAVTGSRIEPVLEAAHIRPVKDGGVHHVGNGMLLRSDVHKLFDDGYLGVDEKFRLRVSPRLKSEFGNGFEFYEREQLGLTITLPHRSQRPDTEALTWHMDTVFLSA